MSAANDDSFPLIFFNFRYHVTECQMSLTMLLFEHQMHSSSKIHNQKKKKKKKIERRKKEVEIEDIIYISCPSCYYDTTLMK